MIILPTNVPTVSRPVVVCRREGADSCVGLTIIVLNRVRAPPSASFVSFLRSSGSRRSPTIEPTNQKRRNPNAKTSLTVLLTLTPNIVISNLGVFCKYLENEASEANFESKNLPQTTLSRHLLNIEKRFFSIFLKILISDRT